MPWCPICKNEYKEGYTVCVDCNCELVESLGNEMVGYFGTEDEIDDIISYLKDEGFDFTYKRYNNKDGQYELVLQENKKEVIRDAMVKYLTSNKKLEVPDDNYTVDISIDGEEEEQIVQKRYKKPKERAAEYKAGAQTLIFVGIVGIVFLILMDMGVVSLNFSNDRKYLINIVMGGMFALFVILGIGSFRTYKKLAALADTDNDLEEKIMKWFKDAVKIDDITRGENSKESEEVLYFNRYKRLKNALTAEFKDLEPEFVEYITEKLYNDMF